MPVYILHYTLLNRIVVKIRQWSSCYWMEHRLRFLLGTWALRNCVLVRGRGLQNCELLRGCGLYNCKLVRGGELKTCWKALSM